jgi:UDP-N-acetyl-D-galactosamine dehydrogenase
MRPLNEEKIAVIGLGYVGLPVAIAFGRTLPTVGFDIRQKRVDELKKGHDDTLEVSDDDLAAAKHMELTADASKLADCTVFIVAVPTPIDGNNRPDLGPSLAASRTIGPFLKKGDVVIYESTWYPGVTEELCGPLLDEKCGLKNGVDYFLAYSPERINPGDKEHTFSGSRRWCRGDPGDPRAGRQHLRAVVTAGVHRAPSIKVAEAAKVIENTQRDINIALDERARADLRSHGHPHQGRARGRRHQVELPPLHAGPGRRSLHRRRPVLPDHQGPGARLPPEVILAGRRINNNVGPFIAQKTVKMLTQPRRPAVEGEGRHPRADVQGERPGLRNSKVPDIVKELAQYGIAATVTDPWCNSDEAHEEYGVHLTPIDKMQNLDALIFAVNHEEYAKNVNGLFERVKDNGVLIDVKSAVPRDYKAPRGIRFWSL